MPFREGHRACSHAAVPSVSEPRACAAIALLAAARVVLLKAALLDALLTALLLARR